MVKKTKDNKTNGTNGVKFNEFELTTALRSVEDLMERVLVNFVVLGDTSKAMFEGKDLYGGKIEIGIFKNDLVKFVRSTLNTLVKDIEWTKYGFTFKINNVPVMVRVISRSYKFFDHPDFRFYRTGQYRFANPFELYWKSRFFIA